MKILGLFIHAGQTSASILVDGTITAAVAEERFDRIKRSRAFPKKSINFCLKQANVKNFEELDGIAVSWNPAENMRNINLSGFTQWRRYDPEWLYIVPNNLMSIAGGSSFTGKVMKLELGENSRCPIYFVDHHMCHLAHAVCHSPFENGLAIIADEYGELNSVTIATFNRNNYTVIKEIPYPHSLGVFYAAFTEYLGFTPNSDEWKLMGAAAYGNPKKYRRKIESIIEWDESDGEWILDQKYIEHANMKRAGYANQRLFDFVGLQKRMPDTPLGQDHFDLAAGVQAVFEKRMQQLISHYSKLTGQTNLAASGGCFMNSLANGKIIGNTPIRKLFVPYAAADNGGAIGAPLFIYHYHLRNKRNICSVPPSPFLVPEYSDDEIEAVLRKFKLKYKKLDDPATEAARLIASGKLVGWFQGRMEFGERALGNRSILADPRDAGMKDKINIAVKYREAFRPFAPSVLEEMASEYFELPDGVSVPYMEQVYPVKKSKRKLIPAVVHADGTGRLQTVSKSANPIFHRLIREFNKLTGIPVVLNTSFNIQGEPIVCSPEDAVKCFYTCGLDFLIIGTCLISKNVID